MAFSTHWTLRGGDNELFVLRGGGTELKSNCGYVRLYDFGEWRSKYQRKAKVIKAMANHVMAY